MHNPSLYESNSVRKIMFFTLVACIPGICTKCYFFGFNVLTQVIFSMFFSVLLELIVLKLRHKDIKLALYDNSALVTGLLLGLSLPSFLPYWIIIIGLFFSIVVTKHLYGGLGHNIFNPAMMGYVVLLISFPLYMKNWTEISFSDYFLCDIKNFMKMIHLHNNFYEGIFNLKNPVSDYFFTEATPLDQFKTQSHVYYKNNIEFFSNVSQNIIIKKSWEYINVSFLLGGLFLLYKKIICWRIPLFFLATLGFISSITWWISKELFASPFFHLFSGGTMMCAFFIATDPITTACTNVGRLVFSIMIGCLVWIIRNYSDYPDSIAFSVLFANMTVPLIDHFIQSRGYGHHNKK